jgi:short-chain fatty acids transporter
LNGRIKTSFKKNGQLEKFASSVTNWAERWFPDSYIFAVLAIVVVALGAFAAGVSPTSVATAFGDGYWSLIPFTMQMAIVTISGYIVASSPPAGRLINWLAKLPKSERSAVAYVAFFTILASLLNWAFSLVFGGLYVRALARRTDLRMDYRAAGAAGYLGLGAGVKTATSKPSTTNSPKAFAWYAVLFFAWVFFHVHSGLFFYVLLV